MSKQNRIKTKISAIDIGSNGARMLINRILIDKNTIHHKNPKYSFKNVEYVRFPLRLGLDVFHYDHITEKKQIQLLKLMKVFKLLNDLHEVESYWALATSAFREASNGKEIAQKIKEEIGIDIKIITGKEEASILQKVINNYVAPNKNYLHIDVGGGSTEINFYHNQKIVASQSFEVGTVRNSNHSNSEITLNKMKNWLEDNIWGKYKNILAIGTGGNINKIASLSDTKANQQISYEEIQTLAQHLENFSFEDKVNILKLNPDRADTIVPASKLYLSAMKWGNANTMIIPKVGLKDGMMEIMLENHLQNYK